MTVQDWISDNRYANTIPRRVAALTLKFLLEGLIFSVAALVLAFATDGFLNVIDFEIQRIPETWPILFLLFLYYGFNLAWCFTSDSEHD